MQCNLTIDIGNSFSKLALWHNDTPVATHRLMSLPTYQDFAEFIGNHTVNAIAFCSVIKQDALDGFADMLKQISPRVYQLDYQLSTPLKNAYATPETLGMDRLAAACGAYSLSKGSDILVVDMGTAVTYDFVSSRAEYRGGNIAPGLRLRLMSLNEHTQCLPLEPTTDSLPDDIFGKSTHDAILLGCIRGIAAEILYYATVNTSCTVCLTGHDAATIIPLLQNLPVITDDNLVGRGLNTIINHNLQYEN
ncbi:MAG: type III pantothenate kinase [Muribaculaceae bacterium]|nr:type III pantothenate kinase [Muribaculaceae bacterium]